MIEWRHAIWLKALKRSAPDWNPNNQKSKCTRARPPAHPHARTGSHTHNSAHADSLTNPRTHTDTHREPHSHTVPPSHRRTVTYTHLPHTHHTPHTIPIGCKARVVVFVARADTESRSSRIGSITLSGWKFGHPGRYDMIGVLFWRALHSGSCGLSFVESG